MRSHSAPELGIAVERSLPGLRAGQKHRSQHGQHEQRAAACRAPAGRPRARRRGRPAQAKPTVASERGRDGQPHHVHPHVEEERHAGPQHDLEHEQLEADGGRLAEEDPGRVDAREPKAVPGALARLDGHAALNRQHGGEEHGDPEDARCGVPQRGGVGPDGEGQEDEDEDGEGHDLPQGDPGPCFDPQVLAGHQKRVTPHATPPCVPVAAARFRRGHRAQGGPAASAPRRR